MTQALDEPLPKPRVEYVVTWRYGPDGELLTKAPCKSARMAP